MSDKAPAWVVPVMRAGYSARGVVYTVVGGLALLAAVQGNPAQGTTDALADLRAMPWGFAALWAIAVGLWAYTAWRLIDAFMDLEDYGHDVKGMLARAGLVITGLIHATIGLSVATTAIGGSASGGGTQSATQKLMALPYGPVLVGLVGIATVGAGIYYAYKGYAETYKDHIRVTPTARKLDPVMKFGCIAEGAVVTIIGTLILIAAWRTDPAQAGGVGEALGEIRSVAYGRILLGVVALGLIGFAVENFVEAAYRIVPRRAGRDVMTLAHRAKLKAQGKLRQATA
ncbi:DUF1206 domain-containing protein [Tropicibacter naphthalenivorans]|uniref:DUF1206 domain-containing protein n=1 Tax=Tropicibacter naphthalenivorans TaxID=441103 RepID=A0A0N7LZ37_9RHOB|nr:DUF1206 domain-containing protein [Tropicibacter naphthalenivorans]CUH76577.1 hypothetical protein TRN7648_01008 [Tropicibacter naphthalenivorans]SMC65004.1 protein of unknown function [Tropicibacter naphthalenivorans]